MNSLITVIVPVYNGQDYLLNCINCIQNQSYENIEIIVVDDGSKDGTAEICRELEQKYADSERAAGTVRRTFKCITLGDEGVSAARNAALDQISGMCVAFVDADDRIKPDMLQHLYELLQENDCDVAGCDFFIWGNEEQWETHMEDASAGKYKVRRYEPQDYIHHEILRGNTRCWSKLYRREVLERVRFELGLTIGEDMLFLVRLQEHIRFICESSYPGYGYYQNATGVMQRKFTGQAMDQIVCWEKVREELGASPSVDRHIVISVMLVAGRLAQLDREERKEYAEEASCCHRKLRKYLSGEVYRLLDGGYRIKTVFYLIAPKLYLHIYHNWKRG